MAEAPASALALDRRHTFEVPTEAPHLHLRLPHARVHLCTHDASTRIHVRLLADAAVVDDAEVLTRRLRLVVAQEDQHVRVVAQPLSVEDMEAWGALSGPPLWAEVLVPRGAHVDAEVLRGTLEAEGLTGHSVLHVCSGTFIGRRLHGVVAASASASETELVDLDVQHLDLNVQGSMLNMSRSSVGTLTLRAAAATCSLADVTARQATLNLHAAPTTLSAWSGPLEARTAASPLAVHFAGWQGARLHTVAGRLTCRLPDGTGADLDVRALEASLEADGFEGDCSPARLRGTLVGGGPKLHATATRGTVHVV